MQVVLWILAIIVSAAAGYWVYLTDKKRAIPKPWITSLLRSIVVFFTIVLLLFPVLIISKNIIEKPIIVFLQDDSRSVAVALGKDSLAYQKNATELVNRLSDKYNVVKWSFGNSVVVDTLFRYKQNATDISAALLRAQEFYGMQNLGAVVLASDGRYNQGVNPLFQQLALHCPVYTIGIGDTSLQKDISIARINANKVISLGSSFEIRFDLIATLCKGYKNEVLLSEDGRQLNKMQLTLNSDRYDRTLSFVVKPDKVGVHHYSLAVAKAEGETNITNNRRDVYIEVTSDKKNVLIISAAPHPDVNAIKEALTGLDNYNVTSCTADQIPSSLFPYNAIILHGLPSQRYNIAQRLIAAGKPVWLILTSNTSFQTINELQPVTHTTITPIPPHNNFAVYNPEFNGFSLSQKIQTVIDKMPPLVTNVGNINPAPGANVIFNQKVAGASPSPLWVLQHGRVPSAILLGEGIWRWRLYEFKNFNEHNVIDECIKQTVTYLCTNDNDRPFYVTVPKQVWSDQEPISLQAFLYNANRELVNTPDAQITITDSAGAKQDYTLERSGANYGLNIGLRSGGKYSYNARTNYNEKSYTATGSFTVESTPLEFMETGADFQLLYGLAKKYNGAFTTINNMGAVYDSIAKNEKIRPVIQTNTESVPLIDRKWYFFIILIFAVGEWILRKYWLAQ